MNAKINQNNFREYRTILQPVENAHKYASGNNEKVDNYDTSEKCTSTIPYDRHKNQATATMTSARV
jgi:hypothetical protein